MPEGPECKLTVEYLNKVLKGRNILDWVFSGGRYTEKYPKGFKKFHSSLPLKVLEVCCKGKFIYFILEDKKGEKHYILHSLMMTGRWQKDYDKYCKWFLELNNDQTIWFRDTRNFATLIFTKKIDILQEKINKLGPDILTKNFELPVFKELINKYPNRNITSFMMDQEVISGCGNYIKAEVLYYACISPLRKVCELTPREVELLYEGLIVIPRISYNYKGLSIRDYSDPNGKKGYYQEKLKVYGKKNFKRTKTPDGRITYWDPKKQK